MGLTYPRIFLGSMLFLCGCSANPFTGEQQVSNTALDAGLGAGLGAGAGYAAGTLTKGDTKQAALVGAGVGAAAGAGLGLYLDQQEANLRAELREAGISVLRAGNDIVLIMDKGVTFARNESRLLPKARQTLMAVAKALHKYNKSTIYIDGHANEDEAMAQSLSDNRANAVANFLVSQNISASRMKQRGLGAVAALPENRFVEIKLSGS